MNIIEELKKGENNRLEFKREFPKSAESFLKTVVAFSNGYSKLHFQRKSFKNSC